MEPTLKPYSAGAPTAGNSGEPTTGGSIPAGILPIQHYLIWGEDRQTVSRAHVILVERCMAARGFVIKFPPPRKLDAWLLDFTYRRYGAPETLTDAKKYGYGVPDEDVGSAEEQKRADEFNSSLTPGARVALGGDPREMKESHSRLGCFGEADKKLMGDGKLIRLAGLDFAPIVREVNLDPRSTDSPETRAAAAAFSQCMADAGYSGIEGPLDRPDSIPITESAPTEAEIRAAVKAFECAESTRVKVIMRETEVKFQLAAIEKNPEAFAQIKAENEAVIRRAVTVVKGG